MSARRLLFLAGDRPWIEATVDGIVRRGAGHDPAWREGEAPVAVAPASEVAVYWLDLPDLSPAQANAAARLMLTDKLLGDAHVACGPADEAGVRAVAVVSSVRIAAWIAEVEPAAILPAQLIVAAPAQGFVRAGLGPETVIRGPHAAFADDPALTPLLTGGERVETLDREGIEANTLAALAAPPLDLRQGVFTPRRSWLPDRARLNKLGWMAAALALISLAIPLTRTVKLERDTARIAAQTADVAQRAMGEAVAGEEAAVALNARLAAMRGGGGGFSGTAGGVIGSVSATPNVELTAMNFGADGVLRVTARATAQAELDTLVGKLRDAGLDVTAGAASVAQGRPVLEIQVRGR